MDIQVKGIQGLVTALVAIGFQTALVREPDEKGSTQTPVHTGGENELQASIEVFQLIANGSAKNNTVPPNSAHIQVCGNTLTGKKRSLRSPWLEVEQVQSWVRSNQ